MSAAIHIIRETSEDGLTLGVTSAGKIAYRGPREAVERWLPMLVANKAAIIAKLLAHDTAAEQALRPSPSMAAPEPAQATADLEARRAAVERLRDAMQAENERRREWMSASPYDRDGNLTIRSILTGETTIIELGASR